jgi:SAM-dependent methyltransferase
MKQVASAPNSSRAYLEEWIEAKGASLGTGSFVLDAGAGDGRYARHFQLVHYESADFGEVDKPYATDMTYVCDLQEIPVEDQRFNAVLCTQVLEHIRHPSAVLNEFRRILKPGGELWLTVPLFFEEHEQPYDYFRYTQFALQGLLADAGFRVDSISWLEGYFGTLAYQCGMASRCLPRRWLPARVLFALAASVFARADLRTKLTNVGMCKNYAVTATKL